MTEQAVFVSVVPHPKCCCFTFSPFAWVYWGTKLWQHSTPIQNTKRIKLRQQRWPRFLLSEPAEHSATCQSVYHIEKIPPADFPFSLNKNYNAARIKPRLVKWSTWPRGLVVKFKPELPQLLLFTFSLCNASGLGAVIYAIHALRASLHLPLLKHTIFFDKKKILLIVKSPLKLNNRNP